MTETQKNNGQTEKKEEPIPEKLKPGAFAALMAEEMATMHVHTSMAMDIFNGKDRSETRKFYIPGARGAASSLSRIFILSAMLNPYADVALIEVDKRVDAIKEAIQKLEKSVIAKLEVRKAKGITYSILASKKPVEVALGFKTPYGYMLGNLIVEYDYLVRVLRTAERYAVITCDELYAELRKVTRLFRSMYSYVNTVALILQREDMRQLSRADYLPSATQEQILRKQSAKENLENIVGVLTNEVLAYRKEPQHRARYNLRSQDVVALRAMLDKNEEDLSGNDALENATNQNQLI